MKRDRVSSSKDSETTQAKLIPVYIMGRRYQVPEDLTIMTAMEYAGYQLKRGAGCREGFCGACVTVYRSADDYKLKAGLACQTVVEPEMYVAQIPFTPANKPTYDIKELQPSISAIQSIYPEVMRCLSCNSCTKVCPQNIEVMDYMQAAVRGDIAKLADLSFDCIMCGICAMRCPAEIVQYNMALLGRRLYGKYLSKKGPYLEKRVEEIKAGKYEQGMQELMRANRETLSRRYDARDIESE